VKYADVLFKKMEMQIEHQLEEFKQVKFCKTLHTNNSSGATKAF
jgi:hypothetical protein